MVSKKQAAIDAAKIKEKEDFEENEEIKKITIHENILKLYPDALFITDQDDLDRHAKIKNFENAKPNAKEAEKEIKNKYNESYLKELSENGKIRVFLVDREIKTISYSTKKYEKGKLIDEIPKKKISLIPFKAKNNKKKVS